MTTPDNLLSLALRGDYIGDSATLGRILVAEIRRVTRERDYAIRVLSRLSDPTEAGAESERAGRFGENGGWYRSVAGEAVERLMNGSKL